MAIEIFMVLIALGALGSNRTIFQTKTVDNVSVNLCNPCAGSQTIGGNLSTHNAPRHDVSDVSYINATIIDIKELGEALNKTRQSYMRAHRLDNDYMDNPGFNIKHNTLNYSDIIKFSYDTMTAMFLHLNISTNNQVDSPNAGRYNIGNQEWASKILGIACKLNLMSQRRGGHNHPSAAYCYKSEPKKILKTDTEKMNFVFACLGQAAKITNELIQKWERYRIGYEGRSKTRAASNRRNSSRPNRSVSTLSNKQIDEDRVVKCVKGPGCRRRNPKRKTKKQRMCRRRRKKRCKGKRKYKPTKTINKDVSKLEENNRNKRMTLAIANCDKWKSGHVNVSSTRMRTSWVNRREARIFHICSLDKSISTFNRFALAKFSSFLRLLLGYS